MITAQIACQPNPDYDLPETAGHWSQKRLSGSVVVDLMA